MHQHPRPSPISASPANSPQTNPMRSNNSREQDQLGTRATSRGRSTPNDQGTGTGEATEVMLRVQEASTQGKDAIGKLSQIVQNYFTKAALLILHSRVSLPPAYAKDSGTRRVNKWFNIEIDETDVTREDLRIWKSCDAVSNRPTPMVIETFIDTQDLTHNQSLVVIDEQGRRCDVEEAFSASSGSSGDGSGQSARPEVIIERWIVQLGEPASALPRDLGPILPRTYKNAIVLYRSLYTCARLLPAWKYAKRLSNSRASPTSPKLKYRILQNPQPDPRSRIDHLSIPLIKSQEDVMGTFTFDPVDSPAGPMSIHVTYRNHCDFRIADSEALLSSRFMGIDEQHFEPSLGRKHGRLSQSRDPHTRTNEIGSLPQDRRDNTVRPDPSQAYGSMSTFHQTGPPTGTSPLSALRAARIAGSESPEDIITRKVPPNTRSAQGSRSSLRSADGSSGVGRRPSVSFMPFKTPSLSASPSQAEQSFNSVPRGSLGKASPLAALAEARAPSTLGPHGSVPSRASPSALEQGISSISSSPKPGPPVRYSTSFGHRKAKLSTGSSRTEDDNSSGKTSMSSAAQPGSGVLAEGGNSSGSVPTDDDNISDFLKMLDQKKDLKSFRTPNNSAASEASNRRTSAALNKYQRMRDTNRDLSESMSSSLMLQRSSSTSSRQLSNVPAMVAGTSMSTSPSPGKPISPHTPHTPTIPSRLSANSVVEYDNLPAQRSDARPARSPMPEDADEPRSARATTPGAIDIPTSPRPYHPNFRRSNSAAQGPRAAVYVDDDPFPFAMRSASLGVEDRPPVSLTAPAGLHHDAAQGDSAPAEANAERREFRSAPVYKANPQGTEDMVRPRSSEGREEVGSLPLRGTPYRLRVGRGSGRGDTPPQSSSSSLIERGSGSGSSDQRGGRYSSSRPASTFEDDEPLLFAMSDFSVTQHSRRSLEETRSTTCADRGGADSDASSRRGSRRGGY